MKKNNGVILLEVLIAVIVAGMVLAAILTVVNVSNKYARHNANKTMALYYIQELMEEVKNQTYEDGYAQVADYHEGSYTNYLGPEYNSDVVEEDDDLDEDGTVDRINGSGNLEFDDADDYNGYSDTVYIYQNQGVDIAATRTVSVSDQDGNTVLDSGGYQAVTHKIITVVITWDWLGKTYTEQIDTIVTNYS